MSHLSSANIILRPETPADYHAVEEVSREAFWDNFWGDGQQICDEHYLVSKLRTCPPFMPKLDYVAEIDGKVVGHIIYTKSKIVSDSGHEHEMLTFGPLAVLPEYQSRGIGRALMFRTFEIAKQLGFRAVIIFGHPDYYPRVGFRRCAEFGITTSDGKTFDPFMVYPLYEGALDGISGKYYIDPVYESLTQEDALEFDKKFPPKNLHTLPSIDILLDRLQPDAQRAIKGLNCNFLTIMKTKSEREIRSLEGINDSAIEVIRAVMRECKLAWGK